MFYNGIHVHLNNVLCTNYQYAVRWLIQNASRVGWQKKMDEVCALNITLVEINRISNTAYTVTHIHGLITLMGAGAILNELFCTQTTYQELPNRSYIFPATPKATSIQHNAIITTVGLGKF